MIDHWLFALTLLSALGCGLIAGAFFAFSAFVMRALAALPPTQGIAAMTSINVAVIDVWFLGVLFGTAALCLVTAVWSVRNLNEAGAGFLLAGSLLYLILTIGVTVAFNVPLNDRLARTDPDSAGAATTWASYATDWTRWNHIRTIGALVASASFIVALDQHVQSTGAPF